ncbi:hypothetical protein [Paenibacillus sp. BJ-4]|uniref:hypothetical protein n=1 Tax=Paenibacillus sp. BJ-4 TaxID=2878097 RepID=UPI001CF09216|nr:hypothetical protein [Paenibacillus sp. BJ-4]
MPQTGTISATGTTRLAEPAPIYRQQKANTVRTFAPTRCSSLFTGQAVCWIKRMPTPDKTAGRKVDFIEEKSFRAL